MIEIGENLKDILGILIGCTTSILILWIVYKINK